MAGGGVTVGVGDQDVFVAVRGGALWLFQYASRED